MEAEADSLHEEAREFVQEANDDRRNGRHFEALEGYQKAIAALQSIPESSDRYESAQKTIGTYQTILVSIQNSQKSALRQEQAAEQRSEDALGKIQEVLREKDPNQELVIGVDTLKDDKHHLGVMVSNRWILENDQSQEYFLTSLGQAWRDLSSPNDPNKAYVFVVNQDGDMVGSYGPQGASVKD